MSKESTSSVVMSGINWSDYSIRIVRLDANFPLEAPDSYVIGFNVTHKQTQRSKYADVRIPHTETADLTEEEVTRKAWTLLTETFTTWAETLNTKAPLLGAEFYP